MGSYWSNNWKKNKGSGISFRWAQEFVVQEVKANTDLETRPFMIYNCWLD